MKIGIVTPAPPGSQYGNRITALRWATLLKRLGHRVSVVQRYKKEPFDLLIALHARRSYPSIRGFRIATPQSPIVVALTGTDLYRDFGSKDKAQASLELATRIVVLQPLACQELPKALQRKTRVIYQSATNGLRFAGKKVATTKNFKQPRASSVNTFDVCSIAHLRAVKDPFRTAMAARMLPPASRIRVLQVGDAMTNAMEQRARSEMKINQRYHWLGELPHADLFHVLAKSDLCVISSRSEGGANVLSEAIVASVPVLASRVNGNVGILGVDYPGLFDVGDTRGLAQLLRRAETEPDFLADLKARCKKLGPLFNPKREERVLRDLIKELHSKS
ncbi:MAG TPA: selenoneine biosynthesis selenosugar synthase SenB [Pyrinomonadaceae bacterium]|nr:selenoneine biosynthesis selenosugar synthase SenB [Pyrinomonadaceae bacterium]